MKRLIAALGLLAALLLTGCSGSNAESATSGGGTPEQPEVAVITGSYGTPAAKYAIDAFEELGTGKGWKVTVSDTDFDFNQVNSLMQDAALRKVDAIVLGFPTPEQITVGLKAANDAEVPVYVIDGGTAPMEGVTLNVTSDSGQLAEISAQALLDAMGGPGKVLVIGHDPHPGIRLRTAEAIEYLEAAGAQIVDVKQVREPASSQGEALNFTNDFLQAHQDQDDLDGVWAGWDAAAMGVVQSLNSAGRTEVPVTGIDATDQAVAEIKKDGPFTATVFQDWDAIVGRLAEVMEADFAGTDPGTNFEEKPGVLVTEDNAETFNP
ncbi:LacI family transcriptional regulator [Kocuria dechangensis]|uniref:LacI family transcriptional regulator n=1 Tax=Kocuria dechangensis TaxID=1176249 RepID=A0A917GWW0_9MICC|nr:sugar ABC transporter substrate-binding protein [Kocuria dechangensis]GGG60003.1 LacI family transcriptional regulator [Kocuria dechangensis]